MESYDLSKYEIWIVLCLSQGCSQPFHDGRVTKPCTVNYSYTTIIWIHTYAHLHVSIKNICDRICEKGSSKHILIATINRCKLATCSLIHLYCMSLISFQLAITCKFIRNRVIGLIEFMHHLRKLLRHCWLIYKKSDVARL